MRGRQQREAFGRSAGLDDGDGGGEARSVVVAVGGVFADGGHELADGEKVWVQVTRDDAALLEAEPGDIVWVGTDAAAGGTTVPA